MRVKERVSLLDLWRIDKKVQSVAELSNAAYLVTAKRLDGVQTALQELVDKINGGGVKGGQRGWEDREGRGENEEGGAKETLIRVVSSESSGDVD